VSRLVDPPVAKPVASDMVITKPVPLAKGTCQLKLLCALDGMDTFRNVPNIGATKSEYGGVPPDQERARLSHDVGSPTVVKEKALARLRTKPKEKRDQANFMRMQNEWGN